MTLQCATCCHWRATDRARSYLGVCAKGAFPAGVPFDMPACELHSSAPQPAPALDMQSQTRGTPMLPWAGVFGGGSKP